LDLRAVTTLLQENYPSNGSRHEGALAIGGVLARAGWSTDDIEHVVLAFWHAMQATTT
jgi:hypothetical protein